MTFNDIFKSNFLEKVSAFSLVDALVALGSAFILGIFICAVYKKVFSGVMYSRAFGVSLLMLTMMTTFVILAVTSNVVLSLGMVGALSIVRFRTAIKDPLDLVFLFWAIATGIILGAGMFPLALVGALLVGAVLVGSKTKAPGDTPYILILDVDGEAAEVAAYEFARKRVSRFHLKSKTVTCGQIELIYEVRVMPGETAFVNGLSGILGVKNVALVSYNGEFAA